MSQTGTNPDGTTRQRVDQLARQVFGSWRTPNCGSWGLVITAEERQARGQQVMLAHQVASLLFPPGPLALPIPPGGPGCSSAGPNSRPPSLWSTASSHDGRRPGSDATSTQGRNLKREAETLLWRTPSQPQGPTTADVQLGQRTYTEDGQLVIVSLDRAGTSLADAVTTGSSRTGRAGNTRRLNPAFVEWLMGVPMGWTAEAPRTDRLRMLGNAVVPSCGAYAIALLWQELQDYYAAREEASA